MFLSIHVFFKKKKYFLFQIKGFLHKALETLVQLGTSLSYFKSGILPTDNNLLFRQAARVLGAGDLFVYLSTEKMAEVVHHIGIRECELCSGKVISKTLFVIKFKERKKILSYYSK